MTAYRWVLLVFLLAVAVQIFLAGLGVFSFGNGDRAAATTPSARTRASARPGPRSSS